MRANFFAPFDRELEMKLKYFKQSKLNYLKFQQKKNRNQQKALFSLSSYAVLR